VYRGDREGVSSAFSRQNLIEGRKGRGAEEEQKRGLAEGE